MKFTLQQLRYVQKIMEKGSLSEAAKDLSITQSGLSLSISQLEKDLGVDLFDRVKNGVVPTAECERLAVLSKKVLAGAYEIEQEFSKRESEKTSLNIGAMPHCLVEIPLFDYLSKNRGNLSWFGLEIYAPTTIYHEVSEGIKRMGIGYTTKLFESNRKRTFQEVGVESFEICRIPIDVFLPANHPLADRDVLSEKELAPYPKFSFDEYLFYRNFDARAWRRNPIRNEAGKLIVTPDNDLDRLVKIIAPVNGYVAWARVGERVVDKENVRVIPHSANRSLGFFCVKRKNETLSALEEDFIDYLAKWYQS